MARPVDPPRGPTTTPRAAWAALAIFYAATIFVTQGQGHKKMLRCVAHTTTARTLTQT